MAETRFRDDFRRNFLTGVAALFPILVTLLLFAWLYRLVNRTIGLLASEVCGQVLARSPLLFGVAFPRGALVAPRTVAERLAYVEKYFPRAFGVLVGLLVVAALVYLVGRFLRGYIGSRLLRGMDQVFAGFPFVKAIYPYARQVADILFGQGETLGFRDVVLVQHPRRGIYSIGFRTGASPNAAREGAGLDLVTVFVPTAPTPLTGYVLLVPPDEVVSVDMSVEEAFRFYITAGMLSSEAGPALPAERQIEARPADSHQAVSTAGQD